MNSSVNPFCTPRCLTRRLLGAGLLALTPLTLTPTAYAQTGTPGTPGTNGTTGGTVTGSFTFSDPTAIFQGTAGGTGGAGSNAGPQFGAGGRGGIGGTGGTGLIASGTNANITILNGTFAGGSGGTGGAGGISVGTFNAAGGTGGTGGDGFAATGAGTSITILGGTFLAGSGGNAGNGNGGFGGNAGSAFSTSPGETASVYGGAFGVPISGGQGRSGNGLAGNAFTLNGSSVTVYGSFQTASGTPLTIPQTFTNGQGEFFGTLANNKGPVNFYFYSITNGGTLTLSPFAAVPEASTAASFGLLLALGLGGMVIAARRRKTVGKASS